MSFPSIISLRILALALFCLYLSSCPSNPVPRETPLPQGRPPTGGANPMPGNPSGGGGIADEIRHYTEIGSPSSIMRALDIIRQRDLGATEYGRVMSAVNITFLRMIYSSMQIPTPPLDPPVTHLYSRIIREAERGNYLSPQGSSTDYLEWVLPFLSLYPNHNAVSADRYLSVLGDLERARGLNPDSFLAEYFMGISYERAGRLDEAHALYTRLWNRFPESYPSALGLSRIMEQRSPGSSLAYLEELVLSFPDNLQVKRQLALLYYQDSNWSRAAPAVAEILQNNNRDGDFILMMAHILIEQGQLLQSQSYLDAYAGINSNDRFYLFLRARIQAETFNNRDAALTYLRSILRNPGSSAPLFLEEVRIYTAGLLLASYRREDQEEGREILRQLLLAPNPSLAAHALALEDAVRREAWAEARPYLGRVLLERRTDEDLLWAYQIESGQGNMTTAFAYARELHERDRTNEEGLLTYMSALIDTGRREEAAEMIDARLQGMAGGVLKGRYFYLRSRTRSNEEQALNDLRSSLFEDPQNMKSLISMFEMYHRRGDERRAIFYLRQALSIRADHEGLRPYQRIYPSAFN